MKLIISGGRNYQLTAEGFAVLDEIKKRYGVTEVVSGRATGVDASGERWARIRKIPAALFPADWKTYGKAADPLRNEKMAAYADALAVFRGGKGSKGMKKIAEENGLQVFDMMGTEAFVEKIP